MILKRWKFVAAFGALACITAFLLPNLQAKDDNYPGVPEIAKEAKLALEAAEAQFDIQQATADDIYVWSRRLMRAELANGLIKTAAANHLLRMKDLNRRVEDRFKSGIATPDRFHAARYYVLEAEAEIHKQGN